jgi:putative tryptophan/tyrosine transport system substrate-binding protein
MRRRDFVKGVAGSATAWPFVARAQQQSMPIIGLLSGTHFNENDVEGVKNGLRDAGYSEGDNIHIEYRSAEGQYDHLPELALDLAHRGVAVVVAFGGTSSASAAKAATATIPIVFANGADPIKLGLVTNLNRPEGNVTGASFLVNLLGSKRTEILEKMIPSAESIGLLINPKNLSSKSEANEMEAAVKVLGKQFHLQQATTEAEIDTAFQAFSQQRIGAFSVAADAYFLSRRDQIVSLAAKYSLPAIYPREEYVKLGGLT